MQNIHGQKKYWEHIQNKNADIQTRFEFWFIAVSITKTQNTTIHAIKQQILHEYIFIRKKN